MRRAIAVCLLSTLLVGAEEAPKPRTDAQGDPLPAGAVARLGSVRFRHGDTVTSVAYLPGGKLLATAGNDLTLRVWDLETGKEKLCLKHEDPPSEDMPASRLRPTTILQATFSADGKRVATAALPFGAVRVWDLETGKEIRAIPQQRFATACLSPDGKSVVVATTGGSNVIWDVATGKERVTLAKPEDAGRIISSAQVVRFSPDSKRVILSGLEQTDNGIRGVLRGYDTATGKEAFQLRAGQQGLGAVTAATFSPDGKTVGWIESGGTIHLSQANDGKNIREIAAQLQRGTNLVFSPDGKIIYVRAATSSGVFAWEAATGKEVLKPAQGGDGVIRSRPGAQDLAVSADGKTLAIVGDSSGVRFLDAATGKDARALAGHTGPVVAFRFDGRDTVTTTGADGSLRTWELATGKEKEKTRRDVTLGLPRALVSPDGKTVIAAGTDGVLLLLDADTGKTRHKLDNPVGRLSYYLYVFSADSKRVATRSIYDDQTIRVFSVETGKEVVKLVPPGEEPKNAGLRRVLRNGALALAPDGSAVAAQGADGTLYVWDVPSGRELNRVTLDAEVVLRDVVFSPEGRLIGVDPGNGTLSVVERIAGKERSKLGEAKKVEPDATRAVSLLVAMRNGPLGRGAAFSPDGRRLALVTEGGKVRVWDLFSGKASATLQGHLGDVTGLGFTPDGKSLLTGGADGTALVWELPPLKPPVAREIQGKALDAAWDDLTSPEPSIGFEAVRALVASPKSAIVLFRERLKPAPLPDLTAIEKLIADLDSDRFATRQRAQAELEKLGPAAAPALKKALEGKLSVGVHKIVEELLEKARGTTITASLLKETRAVEALEHMATSEARELLQTLAKGGDGDPLTIQARAALARIEK